MNDPADKSFWRRRVVDPVLALLKQGLTPGKLAMSLALGCTVGVFPGFGLTSLLCIAVAAVFRLNHVAIQITNWIVYPLQFVFFIPFARVGERLFNAPPLPLSVGEISAIFKSQPLSGLKMFGEVFLHAFAGWLVIGLPITLLIYFAILPLLRRVKIPS